MVFKEETLPILHKLFWKIKEDRKLPKPSAEWDFSEPKPDKDITR